MTQRDLLIEIGTEELPPRALLKLSRAFAQGVLDGLDTAGLQLQGSQAFASPRHLALLISGLQLQQADKRVERRGPAVQAAFDGDGKPTKAAQGFARSCGVEVSDLDEVQTDKGAWLVFQAEEKGQATAALLPAIVQTALDSLPIPKRMRWGALEAQFVRPVHWAILLFGDEVIDAEILSVRTGRQTYGHRFHHPQALTVAKPADYEMLLETEGKVIVNFERRRQAVRAQIEEAAMGLQATAVITDELLDEVTAMVEWPVAVVGHFEKRFLEVPQEALISTMSANQKYFHLVDARGRLLPHFITISNIDSTDISKVREGNERVIRPRFSDAEFFWNQDRKLPLSRRVARLDSIIFQQQLGSLLDKTRRLGRLAEHIATLLGGDKLLALRAAELCKCDLTTDMVFEFTELQGVMGRYYATHDGEPAEVASALDDYYKPRFAGDALPQTCTSQALAIADRLDTLCGIFAIGQIPSGDKDPFALRRAALGVLRIIIEQQLDLDLHTLISEAAAQYDKTLKAEKAIAAVFAFMLDRLKAYYKDQGIAHDVIEAVLSLQPHRPLDIDRRIHAVSAFRELPAAASLAAANKRIGNILKKLDSPPAADIDETLLQDEAEKALYAALTNLDTTVQAAIAQGDYQAALTALATLRDTVDAFFDQVMVMADDAALQHNRLALLQRLQGLFLQVADIAVLQG
ncbi:MAG: glycine--tRNA ligase subunit beta [Gammaproteobacteria bacterium]